MIIFPERKRWLDSNQRSLASFKGCMKKPLVVGAAQINEEFQVETLEGNYKTGKPGDFLMCGVDGELYICDQDIFNKTYDFV